MKSTMFRKPFVKISIVLVFVVVACVPTVCGQTRRGDDKLLEKTIRGVELGLSFFSQDYSSINVDGLFGMRVGQGETAVILFLIIILTKRYSLTSVKLTALYKHLITKTTLTYISASKNHNYCNFNYHYRLSNNTHILHYTHTHYIHYTCSIISLWLNWLKDCFTVGENQSLLTRKSSVLLAAKLTWQRGGCCVVLSVMTVD